MHNVTIAQISVKSPKYRICQTITPAIETQSPTINPTRIAIVSRADSVAVEVVALIEIPDACV